MKIMVWICVALVVIAVAVWACIRMSGDCDQREEKEDVK